MIEERNTLIRNDFSKVVDAYAKYRRDYIDEVYDLIYSFCPEKDSKVLDVGCGTGFVANHLAKYYRHVVGLDKSAEMLEVAKRTGPENTSFYLAPAEALPLESESVDLVTAAAAYHWFDYDKAGKEIYRVLKPLGKMCVFYKFAIGDFNGYLPVFAAKNLKLFIPEIPHTNKEIITDEVFLRNGFSRVRVEEFDFDDIYTKEEILGYIQSHSTFNLLSDSQKEEYKKLNEKSVEEYLGNGKFVFKARMQLWFIEK